MAKVKVYNVSGEEAKEMDLNPKIFGIKPKEDLIHEVVVAQQANRRQNIAHTKIRSEVRGGGRKPWRQKGTGRARHGSIRSPLWVGGGVTFGPRKNKSYGKLINKKVKKKALFMVLTDKLASKNLFGLEGFKLEKIKTKEAKAILDKLPIESKKALIVVPKKDETVIKSFRNIPRTDVVRATDINVLDLINYQKIIVPVESFAVIEKTFLKDK